MGCHTWTYKKISALDEAYKNELVNKEISTLKHFCLLNEKSVIDKIKRLEEEGFDYLVKLKLKENSVDIEDVDDEYYCNIGFDTPFRVYGYPKETFTDKNELLKWLETYNKNKIGFYDKNSSSFVEGYTDELVESINNYFEEHGKNNLYFEFG